MACLEIATPTLSSEKAPVNSRRQVKENGRKEEKEMTVLFCSSLSLPFLSLPLLFSRNVTYTEIFLLIGRDNGNTL